MTPRVEELESLDHTPPIPPHDEGSNHEAGPILRLLALDKNTFVVLESLVHEVVDLIWDFLRLVEQDLLLVVLPVESQILHANAVPVVGQLHSSRVDDSLDLV